MSNGLLDPSLPRIIIVAKGLDATCKSKADIVRRIRRLTREFSATIITGSPKEAIELFPEAIKIIGIPTTRLRWGSGIFILACLILIPLSRGRLIYLSETYNAPAVLTEWRRPIICYGSTHPMQHRIRSSGFAAPIRGLLSRIYMTLLMAGLRRCHHIIAISPQLMSEFIRLGVKEDKLTLSGIGVPVEGFVPPSDPSPPSNGPWICVYHGTVSEERGLSIILDGVRILAERRKDIRIRLVGCTGAQITQIRDRLRQQGTGGMVELLPPVSYHEVPSILWSSHIGISLLEPNVYFRASPPLKVLEYKAAGLPVIANDLETHHLFLRDKVDSIIVDYDAESFANGVEAMIRDQSMWMRLSKGALDGWRTHSDEGPIDTLVDMTRSAVKK